MNDKQQKNNSGAVDVSAEEMDELKRDMRSARLNAWAKAHQQQLMIGAAVLLAVLVSVSFWKEHRDAQRASAASLYYQALNTSKAADKQSLLKSVIRDYDNTAYGALARLLLATVDDAHAAEYLQALLARHDVDRGIRNQARLDLARIRLAAGDKQGARKLLETKAPPAYEQLRQYLLAQAASDADERIRHLQKAKEAESHDAGLARRIAQQLSAAGKG